MVKFSSHCGAAVMAECLPSVPAQDDEIQQSVRVSSSEEAQRCAGLQPYYGRCQQGRSGIDVLSGHAETTETVLQVDFPASY